MLLKKISLPPKNNQFFDAVIIAEDKFLQDEIEEAWDVMNAQGHSRASYKWGPFLVEIRPRQRAA